MNKEKIANLLKRLNTLQGVPDTSLSGDIISKEVTDAIKSNATVKILDALNEKLDKFKQDFDFKSISNAINDFQNELQSLKDENSQTALENIKLFDSKLETINAVITKLNSELSENSGMSTAELNSLREEFISNKELAMTKEAAFSNLISGIQNSVQELSASVEKSTKGTKSSLKKSSDSLLADFDEKITKLRTDTMSRFAGLGGGSMNRQINVNSSVTSTKYADINFKNGANITITKADDNVNKRVNITISSSGGGGSVIGGITDINTDTTASQTLTVGTTGTDFAIVDNGTGDHKFNLPTASTTNRGALSTTDWTTFNNKTSNTGTVTTVSVVSTNGFAGTVANATTTPAITISTSINAPVLSGNGTAVAAATTTGSGSTVVLQGSPTITTAVLGSSTATTQTPADNSTKVATTAYVDNAVLGQNFKEAVKYASTSALAASVYNNGASGVGATLTEVGLGALVLDGSTPSVGDRVLIKNQVSTFQNGLYVVTTVGSAGVAFVLTRSTDANQTTEFKTGDSVFVTAGSTLSSTTWAYTGTDSPIMGTDAITYAQVAGQGSFTGGNGITITGTSIAIDTSITVDKTTAQTLTNKTLTAPIISTISNTGTVTLPTATDTLVARATTDTLTNKRITKRTGTTTSSATPTINTDNVDFYSLTAQTADITSFTTNLSGTPTEAQILWIAITGTAARAITWGSSFESSTVTLPTTTVSTNRLDVGFVWNTVTSKFRCVASA